MKHTINVCMHRHAKRRGSVIAVFLCGLLLLGALTGCGRAAKFPEAKIVGIAMASKHIERWNRDGMFLKEKLEEAGFNVELRFSNGDSYQQNNDIACMIADGIDVLLVCPVDGNALTQVLKDAQYAGIPVIAYDRLIMSTEAVDYYVSFDNYVVGRLLSLYTLEKLGIAEFEELSYLREAHAFDEEPAQKDAYRIELLSGDPADNNATMFYSGMYDAIEPYLASGILTIPSGKTSFSETATPNWQTEIAYKNLQDTLASYYADGSVIDAVIAASDNVALGASQALISDYKGEGFPVITGQDGNAANLRNIMDGKQSMTIYKNVSEEAAVTVELIKALLEGKTLDESLIDSLSIPVIYDDTSYDNGKKRIPSFLLSPLVITRNNMQTLIDTGNYVWDDAHEYPIPASQE